MNLDKKFINEIGRISSPEIFIGVARILKVELMEKSSEDGGGPNPRSFGDVFEDIMRSYHSERPQRRKELYEILRAANKTRGDA